MASSMQMRSTWHTQPPKPPFGELFQACALTSPVTFLTGDHVHKSDLTRSRLRLRPQEIWVRERENNAHNGNI